MAGAGLSIGALLGMAVPAQADNFTVNSLADPGDGTCDAADCTLREALNEANSSGDFDRILFQAGLTGDIQLTAGQLVASRDVDIVGPGAGRINVRGDGFSRVLRAAPGFLQSPPDVGVSGLTISGGVADDGGLTGDLGGGIAALAASNLVLADVVIEGNRADDAGGGLFGTLGRVLVNSSKITNNDASYGGGLAIDFGADTTINDSVVSGNEASETGGGLYASGGTTTISNSTLSANHAAEDGGGMYGDGGLRNISNSTITGNDSDEDGGGLFLGGGTTEIASSIVSGNEGGYYGGGILAVEGVTKVSSSTISGNRVPAGSPSDDGYDGGGIFAYANKTTLLNSTVAGNSAHDGGGIDSYCDCADGALTLRNSTVAGNTAADDGGGLDLDGVSHTLAQNTIVATNTAAEDGPNIDGDVDAAFLLTDNDADAGINELTAGSNLINVDPKLGPLADNGGPTQTMALSQTSPALDFGDGYGAEKDQRGPTRPVELPGVPNSAAAGADGSDIGAFELQSLSGGGTAGVVSSTCRGRPATIFALPGIRTIGTAKGDVIVGTDGPDVINGRGGRDLICGWAGNDRLFGDGGNDTVAGQQGDDLVKGQGGRDRLGGGYGNDRLFGGGGRDGLAGGRGEDLLVGGSGLDRLFGQEGRDRLFGNGGPDRLFGGPKADRFTGGGGRNLLHLIYGDGDRVVGANGNSVVLISPRAKRKAPGG